MGQPKALLPYAGTTLLAHVLQILALAPVDATYAVTGANHAALTPFLAGHHVVQNRAATEGLLTSLQAGIRALPENTQGMIVMLVDLPLVEVEDFIILRRAVRENSTRSLIRFRYMGQPAHPVYIGRQWFAEILKQPAADHGAGFLFQKNPAAVRWIEATSPRGLQDLDTLEEYHAHLTR